MSRLPSPVGEEFWHEDTRIRTDKAKNRRKDLHKAGMTNTAIAYVSKFDCLITYKELIP
jgi:hypothetical protein